MLSRYVLCGVLALQLFGCAVAGTPTPFEDRRVTSADSPALDEDADASVRSSISPDAGELVTSRNAASSDDPAPTGAATEAHDASTEDSAGSAERDPREGASPVDLPPGAPEAGAEPVDAEDGAVESLDDTASDAPANADDGGLDPAEADDPEDAADPGSRGDSTPPPNYALAGFATQGRGTRGGQGDRSPATVYSGAELQAAIDAQRPGEPLTVYVAGRITNDSRPIRVDGASRLSILGVGADAELDGVAIELRRSSDVVIRNLRIHHVSAGEGDAIRITEGSHHVWIDHCTLHSDLTQGPGAYDGLIDISHGSDFITISWNLLRDHYAASLIGHSDANVEEDLGRLRVTFHHNVWRNVGSRLPSVRFGAVHVFDNLYQNVTDDDGRSGSAISSRMGACVRLESNYFENVRVALRTDQSEELGATQRIGNTYGGAEVLHSPNCEFEPPYPFVSLLEPADHLPNSLPPHVGAGKLQNPARFDVQSE